MNEIDRLDMNVNQAMADLTAVKASITNSGIDVPDGTRTSEYGKMVSDVYKAGQSSMVDESKIIEKTVTGTNIVVIDDTSEIPHDVGCKVESVNLFNVNGSLSDETSWGSHGSVTLLDDGRIKATGNHAINRTHGQYISVLPNTTYTLSFMIDEIANQSSRTTVEVISQNSDGKTLAIFTKNMYSIGAYSGIFETLPDTKRILVTFCGLYENNSNDGYTIYDKVQLVEGDTTLPYTPYVDVSNIAVMRYGESAADNLETYTANADGTVDGIKSLCPVMTLSTDVDGVRLTVDYHKSWGKQAEWDAFWDAYQSNGTRRNYYNSFSFGWTTSIFKPKYKIILGGNTYSGTQAFMGFGVSTEPLLDWREFADMIDMSAITQASNTFNGARINYIDVDLSNCTSLFKCFSGEWQKTDVTHITVKVSDKCTTYTGVFEYQPALTHLFFKEGSNIAASLSVSAATGLVKESIESIIRALWDNATEKTLTLSLTAVQKAFETSPGANDGNTSEEWLSLVASKSNWTISLA